MKSEITVLVKWVSQSDCWSFTSYRRDGQSTYNALNAPMVAVGTTNFRGSVALAWMAKLADSGHKVIVEGIEYQGSIVERGWE